MTIQDRTLIQIDHKIKKSANAKLRSKGMTISEFTRIMTTNVAYSNVNIVVETLNKKLDSALNETKIIH